MVNFVLVYKPYTISREREHRWTMWKNMCVFKKVLATKCSTTTNMDTPYLKLTTRTISMSAIIYVITTILVAIVTHLLVRYLYRKRPQHSGG